MFAFPGIDTRDLPGFDDYRFALDLLETEHELIVPGSSVAVIGCGGRGSGATPI